MDTVRSDFVRVLSAEDTCPQCAEVYAWVDQRVCSTCLMAVCPGCIAKASPIHEPLCHTCYASDEEPTRPIPKLALVLRRTKRTHFTLQQHRLQLWMKARELARRGAARLAGELQVRTRTRELAPRRAARLTAELQLWMRTLTRRGAARLDAGVTSARERLKPMARQGWLLLQRGLERSRKHLVRARHRAVVHGRVLALSLAVLIASARREAQQE